jgi:hypothetical protein
VQAFGVERRHCGGNLCDARPEIFEKECGQLAGEIPIPTYERHQGGLIQGIKRGCQTDDSSS